MADLGGGGEPDAGGLVQDEGGSPVARAVPVKDLGHGRLWLESSQTSFSVVISDARLHICLAFFSPVFPRLEIDGLTRTVFRVEGTRRGLDPKLR